MSAEVIPKIAEIIAISQIAEIIQADVCGNCPSNAEDCKKHKPRCYAAYERQARKIYRQVVEPLANRQAYKERCWTCHYEPDWYIDKVSAEIIGHCKYPMPTGALMDPIEVRQGKLFSSCCTVEECPVWQAKDNASWQ